MRRMTVPEDEARAAGLAAIDDDRYADAVGHLTEAVRYNPNDAGTHYDLGRAFYLLWQFGDAETAFRRTLEINSDYLDALGYLGRALDGQGRVDEAIDTFRAVLDKRPDHAAVHLLLAQTLLRRGDFAEGWDAYEWRYGDDVGRPYPDFGVPQWNGEDLSGKTIFVFGEQGYGDTIQFVRYLPLLKKCGATVVFGCSAPLMRLLKATPGIDRVVTNWLKVGAIDYFCPLSSLPRAFKTAVDTVPAETSYLAPKGAHIRRWARRLEAVPSPRVGICWQGRPTHPNDRYRSVGMQTLIDHLPPHAGYVSLQIGAGEIAPGIHVFDRQIADFADTACLVANLDLVITVDTSIAHLAGAVGIETWVALPYVADWRWRQHGEGSAWYPSLRLFRQSDPADWQPVLARMGDELLAKLAID